MFRILSIIIVIASFVWLFRYWNKNNLSFSKIVNTYFRSLKDSITSFKIRNIFSDFNQIRRFLYLTTLLFFILMALSSFLYVFIFGDYLTGLFLLAHVSIAPLFSIFLAILIILTAHSNLFNKNDFISITDKSEDEKTVKLNKDGFLKITFWLIVFFSLPTMISIILSMFPLFGTEGQIYLLNIHRYSALILLVLVIIHTGVFKISAK